MSKQFPTIIFAALLSSLIFLIIVANNVDFILMFVATIPLFAIGLSTEPKSALQAGVLATIPIIMFGGSNLFPAALYFFVFALPCCYVCHMALRHYDIRLNATPLPLRLWYPAGLITVYLALYSCAVMAIATAIFATQEINFPQYISQIATEIITTLSKEYELTDSVSPNYLAFILCGSTAWLWCFFMFGYAWFVNYTLMRKNLAKRPGLSIGVFPIPHWLLTLMSICALASIIGGESMSFLGKSSLFILLIPYFFQGAAILNAGARKLDKNMFLLFIFYFIAIISFWPAMIIAGIGIWNHIKIFNKHLSSGGSSSRS